MQDGPQRQHARPGQARSGRPGAGRGASTRRARPAGARPRASAPPAPPAPEAELDRALAAAAAQPEPEPVTFAGLGLPAPLVRALAARDIEAPFAIQARALPDALGGRDVLGKARTGSGKTLAFGLPAITRLASRHGGPPLRPRSPRGLILVPTRELAAQVTGVLGPLSGSLGVSVTPVYGGVSISRQISRLQRGVDLVVATPGRLIDLMERGACKLDEVDITVLDEADHMADLGFMPAVTQILDATPAGGQRLLFSATLDRGVGQLVTRYLTDPALHAVAAPETGGGVAEHSMLVLPAADKVQIAAQIASRPARTLFFVRTKHGADRLARQFGQAGVDAAAIHGNLNQNQRRRALAGFAAGHPRVLVATDVAARGIHVDDVGLVVHYDPPNDHKDYLHRSGRTARAGADGMVVALVEQGQVRELERMHASAGIRPVRHDVVPGHDEIWRLAASGTPVPPPPPPEPEERPRRRARGDAGPAQGDQQPDAARSRRPGPGGAVRRRGRPPHRTAGRPAAQGSRRNVNRAGT